jgi:alanine racemase
MRIEADINLDNIRDNIKMMKACVPSDMKMLAVIKADAYGHGAIEVSKALDDLTDFYAIACIDEAMELRYAGCTKPLLILGYTDPADYRELIENDIRPAMYDVAQCQELSNQSLALGRRTRIHVKIDTGMSRIGFPCNDEGIENILKISGMPGIEIEGIFTHYAKADEYDKTAANIQLNCFRAIIEKLDKAGVHIPVKHISNSAGIMEMDNQNFDMVRSGIVTYGLYPSEEVDKHIAALKPAMEWLSKVIHVKEVEAGTGIGYGWSYTAPSKMKLATVSAGYADGYPRAQSNKGRVIIHGEYAPIVGRVCMDQFMVDVTHIPDVNVGDEVVLAGTRGDKQITIEEIAAPANSFNYELVCNVGRRVPRVYIRDGKKVSVLNYLSDIREHKVEKGY